MVVAEISPQVHDTTLGVKRRVAYPYIGGNAKLGW